MYQIGLEPDKTAVQSPVSGIKLERQLPSVDRPVSYSWFPTPCGTRWDLGGRVFAAINIFLSRCVTTLPWKSGNAKVESGQMQFCTFSQSKDICTVVPSATNSADSFRPVRERCGHVN